MKRKTAQIAKLFCFATLHLLSIDFWVAVETTKDWVFLVEILDQYKQLQGES